jgi:hypothetical protein
LSGGPPPTQARSKCEQHTHPPVGNNVLARTQTGHLESRTFDCIQARGLRACSPSRRSPERGPSSPVRMTFGAFDVGGAVVCQRLRVCRHPKGGRIPKGREPSRDVQGRRDEPKPDRSAGPVCEQSHSASLLRVPIGQRDGFFPLRGEPASTQPRANERQREHDVPQNLSDVRQNQPDGRKAESDACHPPPATALGELRFISNPARGTAGPF